MNATELALSGSLLVNVVLIWAWNEARYNAAHYRGLFEYWCGSATHWREQFDDLRRNSVLRDPKTGRYVKGYRRHD